jgi:hypothetical protein
VYSERVSACTAVVNFGLQSTHAGRSKQIVDGKRKKVMQSHQVNEPMILHTGERLRHDDGQSNWFANSHRVLYFEDISKTTMKWKEKSIT